MGGKEKMHTQLLWVGYGCSMCVFCNTYVCSMTSQAFSRYRLQGVLSMLRSSLRMVDTSVMLTHGEPFELVLYQKTAMEQIERSREKLVSK